MEINSKKVQTLDCLFYLFLFLHVFLWTLTAIISRYTVSKDTIEALMWGNYLGFGYDKNPYLVGWAAYLGRLICDSASNAWGYYLVQQCFIGLGLAGIYQLAKKLLSPEKALISVLVLEGCFYFNAYVQANNDNYLLIGLIPWSVYFFYKIFYEHSNHYKDFVLLSLTAGLALMSKYSYLIILFCLFVWVLAHHAMRLELKQKKRYVLLALAVFFLVCLPNMVWLYQHHFVAFKYIVYRSEGEGGTFFERHVLGVLNFLWMTFCNVVLAILMFLMALPYRLSTENKRRVWIGYISLAPLIMVIVFYVISGSKTYWEWGAPFVGYMGVLLLTLFDLKGSVTFFCKVVLVLMVLFCAINLSINGFIKPGGSANFPAVAIAQTTEQFWKQHTNAPLHYIGGSRYLAGYIAYYSTDHPSPYNEWSAADSHHINDCLIQKYGAIFVQGDKCGVTIEQLPQDYLNPNAFAKELYTRFPTLTVLGKKTFEYEGRSTQKTTVLFGIVMPNPQRMCDLNR